MAELPPNHCHGQMAPFPPGMSPNIPVSVSSYNFHTSVFGTGPPRYGLPGMYTNPIVGPHGQDKGSRVELDRLHFLNKAHHRPSCSQVQGGADIDLCDNDSSTSSGVDTEPSDAVTATVFFESFEPSE